MPIALCLGVPKAATTWIHRQLEAHPQVACTTTKEIGYWTRNYHRGPDWYRKQFHTSEQTRIFAEVTPHYLNERALSRIASDTEGPRFIVVLRNPYERAFSEYLNARRNGEVSGTFADAFQHHERILRNSLYGQALTTYGRFFSMDRLLITFYEAIASEPERVVRETYDFLGVDVDFVPDKLREKINVGRRDSQADRYLKKLELLSKRLGLRREHLVRLGVYEALDGIYLRLANRRPAPQMSLEDKQLIGDSIENDLTCLERLLGQDFSRWRVGAGPAGPHTE